MSPLDKVRVGQAAEKKAIVTPVRFGVRQPEMAMI